MSKKGAVGFVLGAVLFCSQWVSGTDLGMRIESATQKGSEVTVITTGARFQIDGQRTIQCRQRIPGERHVLDIRFAQAVGPFRIQKQDGFSCTLSCKAGTLTFQGDSLVILKLKEEVNTIFTGFFKPAYHYEKQGRWLLMDADGGFGIYPAAEKSTSAPAFTEFPWHIAYAFGGRDEVWVSLFPPRPFNWNRAFEALEHHDGQWGKDYPSAYPSNAEIHASARHCKILALHAEIWEDAPEDVKKKLTPILHTEKYAAMPQPWFTPKHVPLNMKEFIRVREEAHKCGMKLVVYLSPMYSSAPDLFAEMKRVLDEYKVDGLFFDGISMDFRKSYAIMRRAREILGDNRILYVHCSVDPLGDGRIYCPFIDTYADYILRGESGVSGLKLDDFLRCTVSGYNISNAVGYWCYYGSNRLQGYDASTPKVGQYIETVPTTEDIDAALRNKVFIWRTSDAWKGDLAAFDKEYYDKVELLRQAREKERTNHK